MGKPDLIGSTEVCRILGISRSGLTGLLARRELDYVSRLDGPLGAYLFDRAVVELVARHREKAVAS